MTINVQPKKEKRIQFFEFGKKKVTEFSFFWQKENSQGKNFVFFTIGPKP